MHVHPMQPLLPTRFSFEKKRKEKLIVRVPFARVVTGMEIDGSGTRVAASALSTKFLGHV